MSERAEPTVTAEERPGRRDYIEARKLVHQPIPDFDSDEAYLTLLGKSAEAGYHRALAKLGEYAMRRRAWIEAYYWMWRARRSGASYVDKTLCNLRRYWMADGYPSESSNIHDLFSLEDGSVARALISLDSKFDTFAAKAFLREHRPEYLKNEEAVS